MDELLPAPALDEKIAFVCLHGSAKSLSAAASAVAVHIVSFGCDLEPLAPPTAGIERWDDCPAVSDDFDIAWNFIAARVDNLIERM